MRKIIFRIPLLCIPLLLSGVLSAQTNFLINGGFEDVNTCTEYKSECGVEGWFYLKEVKAQMLENTDSIRMLDNNSFGIFMNWRGYTDFSPVIGSILPCSLQKNKEYIFRGVISAKLNTKLILKPGICVGQKFFVPGRSFSKDMKPDSITRIRQIPKTSFFEFEYRFTATGTEKYFTFGTYVYEDTTGARKKLTGTQTVSLTLDNFQLVPADERETYCAAFMANKEQIYKYDFRHREMDYSLFGKGELAIQFNQPENNLITQIKEPASPAPAADTLKLGDVLFDFNKALLKPDALKMLSAYFISNGHSNIDSIYIEGHTDSAGSDKRNMELSQQRCESVKDWLVINQVSSESQLIIHPFGKTRPVAPNTTAQGRALNRRVEIIIFRRRQ